MKRFLAILFMMSTMQVLATDYICLNVRYKTLDLGEHSFVSIIKNVSESDYCSGEFGCVKHSNDVTTYSLWGSKFKSWRMIKNKKQDFGGLGDELLLSRQAVNFIRHCKELTYNKKTRAYISQMDKFNTQRKKDLHWGYYYGASQFNCTSFSVEFFNKITGEDYRAISPKLGVETPAMLALEIMSNMDQNFYDDRGFFQKLKGIESQDEKERKNDIREHKERSGPKI